MQNNTNIKEQHNVYAVVTEYDKQTEILNNGEIISENLWLALKSFYNNNKTSDMPALKTNEEGLTYLTIDIFENFPLTTLDLSGKEIDSIENLSIFDLSVFTEINLSNNEITSVNNELTNLSNVTILNLSKNQIRTFKYDYLHQQCYSQNLQTLNLSHNNIVDCDLSAVAQAQIDVSDNLMTKESVVLPTNTDVQVNLTHNLIINPDLTNNNLKYGFQGVKNKKQHVVNTTIAYYGLDGVESVKVYSLKANEEDETQIDETEVREILLNETYSFSLGYYRIKFNNENYEYITIYIAPAAPTIKMFRNNEEIELTHDIYSDVELRFYGDENATFICRFNNSDQIIEGNKIDIKTAGVMKIDVYQIVDGYLSFETSFYLEYHKNTTKGFIFWIGAIGIFGALFYVAILFIPQLSKIRLGRNNDKNDLDIK